jgi:hypothetical protein
MTRGEQRRRNVASPPRRGIGDDASVIFVRTDIVDRDLAFAEQAAQRFSGGLGHLLFLRTGRFQLRRIDAAQADPGRQVEPGPQMHPRLESVAIDGPDHIDGMPDIGIAGALQTISASRAAWLSAEGCEASGIGQCTQCRTGNSVPAATPKMNTQGSSAENRRLQSFPG